MSTPEVITLGCRLNAAESATIARLAAGEDDLIVVNRCAVTNEAVRHARQAIRKAKRARPQARIVVTGCAAQVEPETFAAMPEVERVVGNGEKLEVSSYSCTPSPSPLRGSPSPHRGEGYLVSDIMTVRAHAPQLACSHAERARVFVEVQTGCDHRCTFCIIPYGRGPSRSVPAGQAIDAIARLIDHGLHEVVLTGVDLTSYGGDLPGSPSLGLLVERILKHVPALQRLRLSSLDCIEIDPRLAELIGGEPRLMPHLHLSLQSGDDLILKRMKRRHGRRQAIETVARLKAMRPELAIGADLIAGFPTETGAMHENSVRLIEECDVVMGHVFPFSPKAGTPAARMKQLAPAVVKARAKNLREACARRHAAWHCSLVGSRQRVLVEREDGRGHAENFAEVKVSSPRLRGEGDRTTSGGGEISVQEAPPPPFGWFPSPANAGEEIAVGEIVEVAITAVEGDMLIGVPE
ncbi:MAG: tRNA (N(6)-L-threonylcarbamoyladenosine(37)-C(2))-methylthiotransferase MtaB [Sphingosinicella sp.]